MAHDTTVAKTAQEMGNEAAIAWADHIIEVLETNLKHEEETTFQLAKAIVGGDAWLPNGLGMALAKAYLETHAARAAARARAAEDRKADRMPR